MRSWKTQTVLAVLVSVLAWGGCKLDGAAVGKFCTTDQDCSSLDGGYCTSAGICTRPCNVHEDCGCTNDLSALDIADGACNNACDMNIGRCRRVCSDDTDCSGVATCNGSYGYPFGMCW